MTTASVSVWFSLAAWIQAADQSVTLSRFNFPLDTGKLLYAYPAVTVESSVWGENFSGAPSLRSMPTAVAVQSSVWTSSFTPPPPPRTETTAPRESETTEAKPKKKRKIHAPVEEAEKAHPKPAPPEETERARPKPAPPEEAEKAHPKPPPAEETEKERPKKHTETAEQEKPRFRTQQHLREHEETERKEVVDKEVVPPAAAPLVQVSGSAGYYSRYMFRGLDVAYRTGINSDNEASFFGTNAAVSIGNFAVGAWYIESLKSYVPGGAGFDKSFGDPTKESAFRTPQPVRYQEYDLFANYTFRLTHDLALSTGMNFYWFSDGRFWAQGDKHVASTVEAAASLNWTGIPYLNQSLNYYYDFDAFKGAYLEYKVAAHPIQLYQNGDFAIGLSPNFSISYDFRYNGTNNGWNNFEPGLDLPVHINDGLSLNVGVKYSLDLGDQSGGAHGAAAVRTDDRLWFSATFQYAFPVGEKSKVLAERDGKRLMSDVAAEPADPGPWRLSAGAGVRNIHSSFQVNQAPAFDIYSRFERRTGGGDTDLATATRDGNYRDGSVYSATGTVWVLTPPFGPGNLYGASNFSYANGSQLVSQGPGINRQITYHSDRFSYDTSDSRSGFHTEDDDSVVYPYISLTRQLAKWSWGEASAGLGYSYNHSSSQSGMKLVGLQIATQHTNDFFFTYDVDNLFGPLTGLTAPFNNHYNGDPPGYQGVVYDGYLYANAIATTAGLGAFGAIDPVVPFAGPQRNVIGTTQQFAVVAAFRGSKLDTDLHALSIPFDLTVDLTRRIKVHLSTGPTVNLFDVEQQTDTYYQLLDPAAGTQGSAMVQSHKSPYDANTNAVINSNVLGGAVTTGGSSGISAGNRQLTSGGSPNPAGGAAGGGKGSSTGKSRDLPGSTLAHDVNRHSGQELKCGVFGELSVEIDLDAARRWFLEVYARYDYVPAFTISDGATTATIDASSWGSGIGLGFRF